MLELLRDDVVRAWTGRRLARAAVDDAQTRRVTTLILGVGAVLYPLWGLLFRWGRPDAVDPLAERLVVSGGMLLGLLLTQTRTLARHVFLIEALLLHLMTGHFATLLWRNALDKEYLVGTFIVLVAAAVVMRTPRAALSFGITWTVVFGTLAASAPVPLFTRVLTTFGAATVLLAPVLSAFRSAAVNRAAQSQLLEARELLKQVIESIPDPVFVKAFKGNEMVLANEAYRQLDGSVTRSFEQYMQRVTFDARRHPTIELDGDLGLTAPKVAYSLKMALAEMGKGDRVLIGIARDFSDRKALEDALRARNRELEEARGRVQQLEGLLPICMHCHRIRAKEGGWEPVESYVSQRSEASFTHSICDLCMDAHHPV